MASIQPSKRRWLRLGTWSFVLGENPPPLLYTHGKRMPIIMRHEHAQHVLWRIWRWFPGGFGS